MNWVQALKQWNDKKGGKYTIPKKGTKEHAQVMKLMKGGGIVGGTMPKTYKKKGATMPKTYKKKGGNMLENFARGNLFNVGGKLKKVKKGGVLSGMLYKAGFNPNDHNTWDGAEGWLLDNGATQADMKDFYTQIASKLQDAYTQQDWANMGMTSNIHDVEKLIKQPLTPESMDKEDAGDKSWMTGGKLKKKGAGLISVKGMARQRGSNLMGGTMTAIQGKLVNY